LHKVYTHSIQALFISTIGWLFQLHKHSDLSYLTKLLEGLLPCLHPDRPTIALGFKWKNIWDGTKNTKSLALPPSCTANSATPLPQPKHQFIKAVHVEVAKEYEGIAAVLVCKALHSTAFRCTTNLMMKLVPLYSNHTPLMQQDNLLHTITKHAQCLAVFEHVSNPHINCLDKHSDLLSNHSLHLIVLTYWINWKLKTFLSLDCNHSTGQVIFTYPHKYWGVTSSWAHHLVKYMEYENGPPALHWFSYAGLVAVAKMTHNKEEECPVPKSEQELNKISTMTFDLLDCPDLAQTDTMDCP